MLRIIPSVGQLVAWHYTPARLRQIAKVPRLNVDVIVNANAGIKPTYDNAVSQVRMRLKNGDTAAQALAVGPWSGDWDAENNPRRYRMLRRWSRNLLRSQMRRGDR